ncbi:MAG: hypothetical protein FWE23_04795 [Chitinivibrionia bacterium]|nr:hypothetical protein [Chitinivibrionia bacterium]
MNKIGFLLIFLVFLPVICIAQSMHEVPTESDGDLVQHITLHEKDGATATPQQPAPATEAGQFLRSSISLLNVLATRDAPLPPQWADALVRTIQDSIRMARFDYNAISQSVVERFLAMPSSISIEERMNATVVPAVLTAVEAESELRAMGMLTEQQRNSFIVNKARELGITEAELNAVMNSAYIFVVVFNGMERRRNQQGETTIRLSAGGHWWRIDNSGDVPTAVLFSRIERTHTATDANPNRAFQTAASAIAADVQTATRGIPEFQLTAQILSRTARHVEISIGQSEGVRIDDKYRIYESIEDADGTIRERRRGWIMVNKVMTDAQASQSRAQIISGSPYLGAVVREVPELGFDAGFAFVQVPRRITVKNDSAGGDLRFNDVKIGNSFGPRVKISANMARLGVPISQLWVNLSLEYLWGSADGSVFLHGQDIRLSNTESYGGELSFTKKWYIRRFVIAPEAGFGVKRVLLKTDEVRATWTPGQNPWLTQFAYSQWSVGAIANLGVEIAISPLVNIGSFAGVNAFTGNNQWSLTWLNRDNKWEDFVDLTDRKSGDFRLNNMGMSWGIYFSMAIPSGNR